MPRNSKELDRAIAKFCLQQGLSIKCVSRYYEYLVDEGHLPKIRG